MAVIVIVIMVRVAKRQLGDAGKFVRGVLMG
jgi:hypothetical protein